MASDKVLIERLVHQMHPDLFPVNELSEEARFLAKWDRLRDRQEITINFWLDAMMEGFPIPYSPTNTYINITKYDDKYQIDKEETIKEFARIIKFAHSRGYRIEKDYSSSEFNLRIHITDDLEITFYSSRETVCTRVYRGTKVVEAQPAKVEDVYDWECEKISFMEVEV